MLSSYLLPVCNQVSTSLARHKIVIFVQKSLHFRAKYSNSVFLPFTLADGSRKSTRTAGSAARGLLSLLYGDNGSEDGSDDGSAVEEGPAGPTPPISAPRRARPDGDGGETDDEQADQEGG